MPLPTRPESAIAMPKYGGRNNPANLSTVPCVSICSCVIPNANLDLGVREQGLGC